MLVFQITGWQKTPNISRGQESRHGGALDFLVVDHRFFECDKLPRRRIPSDGIPARKAEKLTPFSQWDQRFGIAAKLLRAGPGSHAEGRMVEDVTFWV
jgi:hypothetical protein